MLRQAIVVALAGIAACGGDRPRRDAAALLDTSTIDSTSQCTDQSASSLITMYCTGGYQDGSGSACAPDVAQCESKGGYERMTTEQAGCLCYLCQLYQYANDHMVCATSDTAPGYLLQQCLGGSLRCP